MKSTRLKLPTRAAAVYLGTGVTTKLIGLLSVPIFTRLMDSTEYGRFSLYMSIVALVSGMLSGLFPQGVLYKKYREGSFDVTVAAARLELIVLAAICLLLFAFRSVFKLNGIAILILSLQLASDVLINLFLTESKYSYRYARVAILLILPVLGAVGLGALLVGGAGLGFIGRAAALCAFSLAAALPIAFNFLSRRTRRGLSVLPIRESLPLLPYTLTNTLSAHADRLLLGTLLGASALAGYSVVNSLAVGLTFTVGAVGSALYPWIARRLAAGEILRVSEICDVGVTLISVGVVMLLGLFPEGMSLLAPKEYFTAISAALPIALSTVTYFIFSVQSATLIDVGCGSGASFASVLAAAVGILSFLLLIPYFGTGGAGVGVLLSSLASAFTSVLLGVRKGAVPFSLSHLALTLTVTAGYGFIISLLYAYPAVRILLLIPPALIALSNLNGIFGKLKEVAA